MLPFKSSKKTDCKPCNSLLHLRFNFLLVPGLLLQTFFLLAMQNYANFFQPTRATILNLKALQSFIKIAPNLGHFAVSGSQPISCGRK
jgi:hypothetical protein